MNAAGQVRIEWTGAEEIPDVLRECAEAEIHALRESCGQMRAMQIERRMSGTRGMEFQVSCRCADRQRCIRARRLSLGEALLAFERAMCAHCRR